MADEPTNRRLAAILAADVVGYGRLMQRDEAGTLAALKHRFGQVLRPLVARHRGRVVKLMGDGVLAEFASAVDAVACADALQRAMAEAAAGEPEDRRIVFRIGLDLGDVVADGSDVFGTGVIVASRLQGLAEPGGIWLTRAVHDQVERRLALGFEDLGERGIKNMERPIRLFRVRRGGPVVTPPAVPADARPSIAVLPFANPGGGADEQYISDGIAEDIITELSRYRSLLVIARSSSFAFRGPPVDLEAMRNRLGVRYVVEGGVRRAGDRLRVSVQLIDAASERQLWAERYDRELSDVFAVQEEAARTIAGSLEGRVAATGAELARRKPSADWQAYDCFLQGRELDARFEHARAEAFFARAIELDPGYVHAHAWRALSQVVQYWLLRDPAKLQAAARSARTALSLDEHDARSHQATAYVALYQGQFDLSGMHYERAVALNPNDVQIAAHRANWLVRVGRLEEALLAVDEAMRRDPFAASWIWEIRFRALFHLRRYGECVAALRNVAALIPRHHAYLAAACALAGRTEAAQEEITLLLTDWPDAAVAQVAAVEPYGDRTLLDQLLHGLRLAGLME